MLSDLVDAGMSKLQGLKEGGELAEDHPIWSFPLSPRPFHLQGAKGSHSWVKERLSRLGRGAEEQNLKGKLGSRNKAGICWASLLLGRVFSDHGIPGLDRVSLQWLLYKAYAAKATFFHWLHEGPTKETHNFFWA